MIIKLLGTPSLAFGVVVQASSLTVPTGTPRPSETNPKTTLGAKKAVRPNELSRHTTLDFTNPYIQQTTKTP